MVFIFRNIVCTQHPYTVDHTVRRRPPKTRSIAYQILWSTDSATTPHYGQEHRAPLMSHNMRENPVFNSCGRDWAGLQPSPGGTKDHRSWITCEVSHQHHCTSVTSKGKIKWSEESVVWFQPILRTKKAPHAHGRSWSAPNQERNWLL
jgi:hypothetical protein